MIMRTAKTCATVITLIAMVLQSTLRVISCNLKIKANTVLRLEYS